MEEYTDITDTNLLYMNRLIRYILILTCAITAYLPASAVIAGDWRLHGAFDNSITAIVETPTRVYFTGLAQQYNEKADILKKHRRNLYYYDKKGEETVFLSRHNRLSESNVSHISYNAERGYLMAIYDNLNIDLIHDNGRVDNIAAVMLSDIPGSTVVRRISFDPERNLIWLATDFGYVCLDDKRLEVKESRNYGRNLRNIARLGDNLLIAYDQYIAMAPLSDSRLNLTDYRVLGGYQHSNNFYVIDDEQFVTVGYSTYDRDGDPSLLIHSARLNADKKGVTTKRLLEGKFINVQRADGALIVSEANAVHRIAKDLTVTNYRLPSDLATGVTAVATWDGSEVWTGSPRRGLRSFRLTPAEEGQYQWTLTHDYFAPNASTTYIAGAITPHPDYGLITGNFGIEKAFSDFTYQKMPLAVSSLKNGIWTTHSPLWVDSKYDKLGTDFAGIAVDPKDPKYVWRGSMFNGVLKLNLENPEDVMLFTRPNHAAADLPGFVPALPKLNAWSIHSRVSPPTFDADGTMVFFYNNIDPDPATGVVSMDLCLWSAEDRLASTDAAHYRPFVRIPVKGIEGSNSESSLALKHPLNRNLVVSYTQNYGPGCGILIYNHQGTLADTSDDKYTIICNPYDQDGGRISLYATFAIYEDPETGLVWLGGPYGVLTFNPRTAFSDNTRVNRIKVARNDGTNLADYLLNEVIVYDITSDSKGRKWFATAGAGVVCTSNDGRKILGEFNTSTSPLPSDFAYSVGADTTSGSILISTSEGLAEFTPAAVGTDASGNTTLRVYPNPVAPDYYGYVTIDGLPESAIVKIVDAAGQLVKEVTNDNGTAEWDVTGLDHRRVATGVYYVMASSTDDSSVVSATAKIMVMN